MGFSWFVGWFALVCLVWLVLVWFGVGWLVGCFRLVWSGLVWSDLD